MFGRHWEKYFPRFTAARYGSRGLFRLRLGLIVIGQALLFFSPAQAKCGQWDAWYPAWSITQSDGTHVSISPQRSQTQANGIAGSAKFLRNGVSGTGSIDGSAVANTFNLKVYWSDGSVGIYQGKFASTGRIEGSVYNNKNPKLVRTWFTYSNLNCATQITGLTR